MSLLRRVGLLVAGALVSSLLVALPVAPAHADYDLAVTWPDVTVINSTATDYAISLSDSGPGELYAVWRGYYQSAPHNGVLHVEFPSEGQSQVEIWRCVPGPGCAFAGVASPVLDVHGSLEVVGSDSATVTPSPGVVSMHVQVVALPGLSDVGYDWAIETWDSQTIASGTADLGLSGDLVADVPSGVPDGTYYLRVTAHGMFAGGPISGSLRAGVLVDTTAPQIYPTLSTRMFYPVYDRYRDYLDISIETDESAYLDVELVREDGTDVGPLAATNVSPTSYRTFHWNGRLDKALVDAGVYAIRVTARDEAGNESTVLSPSFTLDHAKKKLVTVKTMLPASKVVYDKYVGKCSALVTPSSHHWKRSLGYYSQTKCKSEKNNASVVLVRHAWWLPTGMRGVKSYRLIKIEQYGGPAVGHGNAYMVMGYIDTKGDFYSRVQFNRGVGWHSARSIKSGFASWVQDADGRPFFIWSNGLASGSRYDVKAFRMTVTVEVLVEPDGTVVTPKGRPVVGSLGQTDAVGTGLHPSRPGPSRLPLRASGSWLAD